MLFLKALHVQYLKYSSVFLIKKHKNYSKKYVPLLSDMFTLSQTY